MKQLFSLYIYHLLLISLAFGQNQYGKYNNVWVSGIYPFGGTTTFAPTGIVMDTFDINFTYRLCNASVCDSLGDLLFYTNGGRVNNRNHQPMDNGDSLLYNAFWQDYMGAHGDIPINQGALILPYPGHPNQYILINETVGCYPDMTDASPRELYYHVIDMSANNGLGRVVERDNKILRDSLVAGQIQAVKHSNGKDWWIVVPELKTACYYMIPFTEAGAGPVQKQCFPGYFGDSDGYDWSMFSPDGNWYARNFYVHPDMHLYRFDRCKGEFTADYTLTVSEDYNMGFYRDANNGSAFSANSRYLYVGCSTDLLQFDLESPNIAASMTQIASIDSFMIYNSYTWFQYPVLAPNDKIYISTGASQYLHVIENPDTAAAYVQVSQHSVSIPPSVPINHTMPNFANYHLGASPQPCWGVGIGEGEAEEAVGVYPNPADEKIIFIGEKIQEGRRLVLYDALNRKVMEVTIGSPKGRVEIDIQGLSEGVYFYHLDGEVMGKFLISR
jgi:hypothetical protein